MSRRGQTNARASRRYSRRVPIRPLPIDRSTVISLDLREKCIPGFLVLPACASLSFSRSPTRRTSLFPLRSLVLFLSFFAAPAKTPCTSIYLPHLFLSFSLSPSLFRARVDTILRPVHKTSWRYLLPAAAWRKKKPNISWRQIVIGACTTGTVPLSADRSLVAGETVQRG